MASGLGFQSTASEDKKNTPRKKTVSRGLIVSVVILVLVLLAYGGLKMYKNTLDQEMTGIQEEIKQQRIKLQSALSDETANFVVRASVMDKELYREYDSNDVLREIENIMILKQSDNSGNRTVLKSFQYNAGANTKKKFDAGNATITGAGSVTITADADTFDVMAQQIDAFKKSEYFDNVQVGTTDRDDYGRIIFTLTMDVVGYDKSPYDNSDNSVVEEVVEQEIVPETIPTEEVELSAEEEIEDTLDTEELPVE